MLIAIYLISQHDLLPPDLIEETDRLRIELGDAPRADANQATRPQSSAGRHCARQDGIRDRPA